MAFQWDPAKAESNKDKHGVEFADAVGVLEDPLALTVDDPYEHEERYVTVGTDFLGRVVVVIWTLRDDDQRIISARPATKNERRQYQQGE
jgi:hypothetical protein